MSVKPENFSTIANFYKNKFVLITGGTGLCGKFIIWKLINSCPEIERVYVLIREKKGLSVRERLDHLLTGSRDLFRYCNEKSLEKIVPIQGDTSLPELGLNDKDMKTIIENVSIVFHSAADLTFQANLKRQILTNVGGTQEVINLCRKLKKLDALVHLSTAYCNPIPKVIQERIYESHLNPKETLEEARNFEGIMEYTQYLGEFGNTYMLTKNMAENLLYNEWQEKKLQCAIVRPGVVSPTLKEPISGWIDSLNGITGGVLMAGVGLGRVARLKLSTQADPIPVDIVANTCITTAWLTANKYKENFRIYHCNTACLNSIMTKDAMEKGYELARKYPLSKAIRPVATPITWFWMLPIIYELKIGRAHV